MADLFVSRMEADKRAFILGERVFVVMLDEGSIMFTVGPSRKDVSERLGIPLSCVRLALATDK